MHSVTDRRTDGQQDDACVAVRSAKNEYSLGLFTVALITIVHISYRTKSTNILTPPPYCVIVSAFHERLHHHYHHTISAD